MIYIRDNIYDIIGNIYDILKKNTMYLASFHNFSHNYFKRQLSFKT